MAKVIKSKTKKKTTPKIILDPGSEGIGGGPIKASPTLASRAAAAAAAKAAKNGVKKIKIPKKGFKPSESDISYALRHGRITKEEAAALNPKKFKILLDDSKTRVFNFKTKKYEPKKKK